MANAPSKSALVYALKKLLAHDEYADYWREHEPFATAFTLVDQNVAAPYCEDIYDTEMLEAAGFFAKDHHWFVHTSNKCAISMPHGDDNWVREDAQDSRWEAHAGNLTGREDTRVGTYDTLQEALDHCLRILSE